MNDWLEENKSLLSEVYFGKTPSIIAIENQLKKFRIKYMGTKNKPSNKDPELLALNRLVEDQFGFGCFSLMVTYNPLPAASTVPIDYSFNAAKKRSSYMVDTKTYKFKKELDYTCIITMTTGLIFNSYFTDEEVMACLLHELGMNFYICFEQFNGILSNLYNATIIANSVSRVIKDFNSAKALFKDDPAGKAIFNKQYAKSYKKVLDILPDDAKNDPEFMAKFNADFGKGLEEDLDQEILYKLRRKAARVLVPAPDAIDAVYTALKASEPYTGLMKKLKKDVNENEATKELTYGFMDKFGLAMGYAFDKFPYISKTIDRLKSLGKFTPVGVLKAIGIKDILLPYKKAISTAKNPLSWITLGVNYKVERAADNFPTMYGYGAAEVSFYDKMKSKNRIEYVNNILDNAPMLGILYDIILTPSKVLVSVFDSSPSGISKCHNQIKMLKAELQKQDLDLKMRKVIEDDIKLCETNLRKLVDITNGVSDPELCRHLYNKTMSDFFNGIGFKDLVLDSGDRFSKYDENIKNHPQLNEQVNNESSLNDSLP